MNIFFASFNAQASSLLKKALTEIDREISVTCAASLQETLNTLMSGKYDVLIANYDLIEEIYLYAPTIMNNVPHIILMDELTDVKDRLLFNPINVDVIIQMPIEPMELYNIIMDII